MTHNNDDPERSARRHSPAIIGIAAALVVAALAFFIFMPGTPDEDVDSVATTAPESAPLTEAEGTEGGDAPTIAPDAAAPAEGEPNAEAPAN